MGLIAVALLDACGQNPSTLDRAFVASMIPHHQLGLELLDDAELNATDVGVRRMVFEMHSYHHGDLSRLNKWAGEWRVIPVHDFPGSISEAELRELQAQSGSEFDIKWLELMIHHHEGALTISEAVQQGGATSEVNMLAKTVSEVQSKELDQMRELLKSLCIEIRKKMYGVTEFSKNQSSILKSFHVTFSD